MPELNNIGLITVLKADKTKPKLTLYNDGLRQKTTGIPELAAIPVDDDEMHTLANNAISAFNALHAKPPTGTSAQLETAESKFVTAYNKNAAFIESAARDAAILAGDVNVGIDIVIRTGYFIKSPKSATTKTFSGQAEGAGSVKITDKAVAPHAGYIRQYGKTTEEGVPPTEIKEAAYSLEVTVMINDLDRHSIYGFRQAIILPVGRKAADSEPETIVEAKATPKLLTKAHIPVFSAKATSNYEWSDWIYVTTL